jgi:MFS family permease
LLSFATAIAGPFFAVYMLKDLNFNYITYTIITITSVLAMIVFMPIWGKFGDKFGTIKVIRITSFLVPLVPLLWFFSIYVSKSLLLIYLILTEIISGFAWAGFNLSASNFVYDAVTREKTAFCFAYFNTLNAFGTFIGAMLGGFIASRSYVFGVKSILVIFLLSGIARFIVAMVVVPRLKEVREVKEFSVPANIIKRLESIEHMSFMPVEKLVKREF